MSSRLKPALSLILLSVSAICYGKVDLEAHAKYFNTQEYPGYHELKGAPPVVRDIGNILFIGDGHEALVDGVGKGNTALSKDERGLTKENIFDSSNIGSSEHWRYCNVAWMWHLHRILVDHGIQYNYIGADQFYLPTGGYVSLQVQHGGHLAHVRQNAAPYRGIPFEGKALTSYGRRASEITGRTSIRNRYHELDPFHNGGARNSRGWYLREAKKDLNLSGELDLDEGNIHQWLGLTRKKGPGFSLPEGELPDIAILRVGLQDLINDTMHNGQQGDLQLGKKKDIEKATLRLLGNKKNAISTRKGNPPVKASRKINYKQEGDMEIIVQALRQKNPSVRILVLPLALYSHDLLFKTQDFIKRSSSRNEKLNYIGKDKEELKVVEEIIHSYNQKLKAWCTRNGVEYLDIPERHILWPGDKPGNLVTARWYLASPRSVSYETAYIIARALGVPGGASFGFPRRSSNTFIPQQRRKGRNGIIYVSGGADTKGHVRNGATAVIRYEKIDAEYRMAWITVSPESLPERNGVLMWVWKDDRFLGEYHTKDFLPYDYFPISLELCTRSSDEIKNYAGEIVFYANTAEGCFAPPLPQNREPQQETPDSPPGTSGEADTTRPAPAERRGVFKKVCPTPPAS